MRRQAAESVERRVHQLDGRGNGADRSAFAGPLVFPSDVFGDAATAVFFDDIVTFVANRILMEYEGIQTEADWDF
ncbi:hypothetical protein [Burkholderia contaminans]|uniref:hypothetical protein n=1 Tax=Burkholderia contaminans TaxID=488447 RepID=UPI00115FB65C|nr:hypothetical protein [Burkholderia contaminans]